MLDAEEQAAITASVPLPFDELSWAGGNVFELRTSWSQGEAPARDWPNVRHTLLRFLEDLHSREAVAFAEGPENFSILKGGGELAERVIPPCWPTSRRRLPTARPLTTLACPSSRAASNRSASAAKPAERRRTRTPGAP